MDATPAINSISSYDTDTGDAVRSEDVRIRTVAGVFAGSDVDGAVMSAANHRQVVEVVERDLNCSVADRRRCFANQHTRQQGSHRLQTPPPVLPPGKLLIRARRIVLCVRWPATGITAYSL